MVLGYKYVKGVSASDDVYGSGTNLISTRQKISTLSKMWKKSLVVNLNFSFVKQLYLLKPKETVDSK